MHDPSKGEILQVSDTSCHFRIRNSAVWRSKRCKTSRFADTQRTFAKGEKFHCGRERSANLTICTCLFCHHQSSQTSPKGVELVAMLALRRSAVLNRLVFSTAPSDAVSNCLAHSVPGTISYPQQGRQSKVQINLFQRNLIKLG